MDRAGRALVAGAITAIAAPMGAAGPPAVEVAIRMPDPGRARVEVRYAPGHRLAEAARLRRLVAEATGGYRAEATMLRPDPAGGAVFETEVAASDDGWVRIGIPLPHAAPPAGSDLSFRARIHPPSGARIVDPFPARSESGEDGSLLMALPAPPALIRFRVVPAGAAAFGVPQLVDGAVAALFLGLAGFAARRLWRPPPGAG